MKKSRISRCLLVSASLLSLFGCGGTSSSSTHLSSQEESSTSSNNYSSDSTSSSISENSKNYNIESGEFKETSNGFISNAFNSLLLFKEQKETGSIHLKMNTNMAFSDNGVVFLYNKDTKVYYSFGINIAGEAFLIKSSNGSKETIRTASITNTDSIYDLSVYFNEEKIECYYNNEFLFAHFRDDNNQTGSLYGLLANGSNIEYSFIETYDFNYSDNNRDSYEPKAGNFIDDENNSLISSYGNSILVNKTKTFKYGELETSITLNGQKADSGIVFGLDDGGKDKFWETGVSYYFLFLSKDNFFFLGKVTNGSWSSLQLRTVRNFKADGTYKIKVIRDEKKIYCYLDDVLYFAHVDNAPLWGEKFGLRAGVNSIYYNDINVTSHEEFNNQSPANYDIASGSFYQVGSQVVSNESKSLILSKEKAYNGTIKTSICPGNAMDNGIIFRLSKPIEGNSFYEEGTGLSYYWLYYTKTNHICLAKYADGVVTKEVEKYLPAGSNSALGYSVKIVMDNNDIYCYFDGRLSFHYTETTSLKGQYFGAKAEEKGCVVSNFSLSTDQAHEENEYLLFGHSYMDLWYTYKEDFAVWKDLNNIGIGGSIASHWSDTYSKEVISYKPKKGVYWIGINDITGGISAQTITNNVEKLLLEIKNSLPEFEIVLPGVNRCPARNSFLTQISQTNTLFKGLDQKYDWIHYVETELMYCDSNGNAINGYFIDGLHPSHDAYKMVASKIIEALN